jgi:hypothetical protein
LNYKEENSWNQNRGRSSNSYGSSASSSSSNPKQSKKYQDRQSTTSYRRREELRKQNARLERDRTRISRVFFMFVAVGLIFSFTLAGKKGLFSLGGSDQTKSQTEEKTSSENSADSAGASDTADYNIMLDTVMGPMLYYNQQDPNWASYLWGGTDDLKTYGCGPTCMAMLVNSFGNAGQYTPITMADWEAKNGQFAQGNGSFHSIVEVTAKAFGLKSESLASEISADTIKNELSEGHLVVELVGEGFFTEKGHFIILRSMNDDGTINIADPNSLENTKTPFTADFLIQQIHQGNNAHGAPLWAVYPASGRNP